jgi:hypothetical protein
VFSLSKCNLLSHTTNHEIKAVVSSRTAINTTLQNGHSSFLTGKAITTRAHIATAAHWFGHKPSTAINDRDLAGPTLQPLHQSGQPNHILPFSLPPIVDCASTNGAATTLEAITALHRNCVTLNPQVRETPAPCASHCCQLDSSLTAATPIIAFLIALHCLTFTEMAAGMVER